MCKHIEFPEVFLSPGVCYWYIAIPQHPIISLSISGTIQIRVRHAGGVRGVRHLVVSGLGVVAASQAEEREKPDNKDEWISAGVSANL